MKTDWTTLENAISKEANAFEELNALINGDPTLEQVRAKIADLANLHVETIVQTAEVQAAVNRNENNAPPDLRVPVANLLSILDGAMGLSISPEIMKPLREGIKGVLPLATEIPQE